MKYTLHNKADATVEVILPAVYTKAGYDIQLLIEKSMSVNASIYLKAGCVPNNIPRIKYLVGRNAIEVVAHE